jgi:RND family efflux transporter MFP subunit
MAAPDVTADSRPASRPPTRFGWRRIIAVAAGLLVALYLAGLLPRLSLWHRLDNRAQVARAALPVVTTAHPKRAAEVVDVPLPGTTEPIQVAGIFARTDGYLEARYVDIGDRVTAGQLLAVIDTPEIDQQLNQAQATLAQWQANVLKLQADLDLANTTLRRYVAAGIGSVSKQQIDERTSAVTDAQKAVDAGKATVNANQANVDRLHDLQGFQHVYAPFDGIITVRNVDAGALISAGSTTGTTELFRLAQVGILRIFVFVPQTYAADVYVGEEADITLRERPGRVFHGTVSRTAGAIDPTSRTLRTEVLVPNEDGALLSGAYVTVHFKIQRSNPPLLIPGTALLVGAHGVRVAIVQADGALHYQPIEIGRDFGAQIEVLGGLAPSDVIASNLPGGLMEGTRVQIAAPASSSPSPIVAPPTPTPVGDAAAGAADTRGARDAS